MADPDPSQKSPAPRQHKEQPPPQALESPSQPQEPPKDLGGTHRHGGKVAEPEVKPAASIITEPGILPAEVHDGAGTPPLKASPVKENPTAFSTLDAISQRIPGTTKSVSSEVEVEDDFIIDPADVEGVASNDGAPVDPNSNIIITRDQNGAVRITTASNPTAVVDIAKAAGVSESDLATISYMFIAPAWQPVAGGVAVGLIGTMAGAWALGNGLLAASPTHLHLPAWAAASLSTWGAAPAAAIGLQAVMGGLQLATSSGLLAPYELVQMRRLAASMNWAIGRPLESEASASGAISRLADSNNMLQVSCRVDCCGAAVPAAAAPDALACLCQRPT